MSGDDKLCHHVLLKTPGEAYFDGGNGVVSEMFLTTLYPGSHIVEMQHYDYELLDRRSYGLHRNYPECPNYSDEFTRAAIGRQLDRLFQCSARSH